MSNENFTRWIPLTISLPLLEFCFDRSKRMKTAFNIFTMNLAVFTTAGSFGLSSKSHILVFNHLMKSYGTKMTERLKLARSI
jgi:hypothetical protein